MSKKKKQVKHLSDREWERKCRSAHDATLDAVDCVLAQILGEWDRDPESTFAYLSGLHATFAFFAGATTASLIECVGESNMPELIRVRDIFMKMNQEGFAVDLLGHFRAKKQKRKPANVIMLPVARRK